MIILSTSSLVRSHKSLALWHASLKAAIHSASASRAAVVGSLLILMSLILSVRLHAAGNEPVTVPHEVNPKPSWIFRGSSQSPSPAVRGTPVTITWKFTATNGKHRDEYLLGNPPPDFKSLESWGIVGKGPLQGDSVSFSMTSQATARNGFVNFWNLKRTWYRDPCDGSFNYGNAPPFPSHTFILAPAPPNKWDPDDDGIDVGGDPGGGDPGGGDPVEPPVEPQERPDQGEAVLAGEIIDPVSIEVDPDRGPVPTRSNKYVVIEKTDPAALDQVGVNDHSLEVTHRIVTINSPPERDLKGVLKLEVEEGALQDYIIFRNNAMTGATEPITLPFQMNVEEPGHVGGEVHDWHAGYESFTFRRIGNGFLKLKISVDPDEGDILKTASLYLIPVDLGIDADRNGTIAQGETASQAKPFRFWINNDDDPNTLGDDVEEAMKEDELSPPSFEDWRSASTLGQIDGVRDLEDFTRMHLTLPSDIVQKAKAGEVQVGFKWTNGSGPRVRVYKAQGDEGDGKYLFYKYEANSQVDSDHQSAVADVKGAQTVFLPSSYWQGVAAGSTKLPFIFEGCEKGTAKLTTVIKFGSSAEAEGAGVWIKLMNVQEMFERGKVASPMSEPDDVPDPWVTTEPLTFHATSDPNGNTFQPDPDEAKQCIIHVHGWRMSYDEAQTWANTSFKRFWHLGYKGRYAFFSWPTYSPATSAAWGYLTYNKSEYRAWLSGVALKDFVATLPSDYTKNLMAHSMGNVVAGSAFRQGMGGISNYALLNAAMAAQAYDPARINIPSRQTPDTDSDLSVQTNFGLSSKFSGITAKITNFYLEDDFATTIWGINHEFNKPQRLDNRLYGYRPSGYTLSDGSVFKLAELSPLLTPITKPPIRGITKPEEAFAFVTQTRSLPAGRTPTNLGMSGGRHIDMSRMVFESAHSAEWIWSLQRTSSVWMELLYSFKLNPNPMP